MDREIVKLKKDNKNQRLVMKGYFEELKEVKKENKRLKK